MKIEHDILLLHGAWADGSSWSKVIASLRGHAVDALTVPLPLTSLDADRDALHRSLERVEGPVVLVGHAYAGAVMGSAADPKIKGLVYIAALAPAEGETVADVFYRNELHPQAPQLAPDQHGLIWLPNEAFAAAFAQNASATEQAVLAAVQRPISAACINQPVGRPLWKDIPSWYLLAEQDHMIVPATQRFMAERMNARLSNQPVDHTPSVSAPSPVVDLILTAARELRG